jgi:succinyl-CoA synthetase beta subunit
MLLLRRGRESSGAGARWCQLLQRRWLNVHEYQGAQLLRDARVRVPPGVACSTVEEVAAAARQLGGPDGEVVLKSQILAGGRGLGTFTNGLKGGVHIVKACLTAPGLAMALLWEAPRCPTGRPNYLDFPLD